MDGENMVSNIHCGPQTKRHPKADNKLTEASSCAFSVDVLTSSIIELDLAVSLTYRAWTCD